MTRKAGGMVNIFKNASAPNRKQHSTARGVTRLGVAIRRDFHNIIIIFTTKLL